MINAKLDTLSVGPTLTQELQSRPPKPISSRTRMGAIGLGLALSLAPTAAQPQEFVKVCVVSDINGLEGEIVTETRADAAKAVRLGVYTYDLSACGEDAESANLQLFRACQRATGEVILVTAREARSGLTSNKYDWAVPNDFVDSPPCDS